MLDLLKRCEEGGFHTFDPELRYFETAYRPLGSKDCWNSYRGDPGTIFCSFMSNSAFPMLYIPGCVQGCSLAALSTWASRCSDTHRTCLVLGT